MQASVVQLAVKFSDFNVRESKPSEESGIYEAWQRVQI